MIEFQFNKITGIIPDDWKYLTKLTYVNLSDNQMTGLIPILWGAQKLEGLDLTNNNLQKFPWEYFAESKFQKLEFINVNRNPYVEMPEKCIRHMYCYKRTLTTFGDGNDLIRVDVGHTDLIERSYDEKYNANQML